MPEISPSKVKQYALRERPCLMCGGPRDTVIAYTTNQGKQSQRMEPRCAACLRARRMDRYRANPDRDRSTSLSWKHRNREHLRAYNQERQADPEHRALKAQYQRLRKARLRSGEGDTPEIRAIYAEAMRVERLVAPCPVFAIPELGHKMHVDHVIPLARGGRHEATNLQILPIGINMRKGARCPR